jgi:hypothetical protein
MSARPLANNRGFWMPGFIGRLQPGQITVGGLGGGVRAWRTLGAAATHQVTHPIDGRPERHEEDSFALLTVPLGSGFPRECVSPASGAGRMGRDGLATTTNPARTTRAGCFDPPLESSWNAMRATRLSAAGSALAAHLLLVEFGDQRVEIGDRFTSLFRLGERLRRPLAQSARIGHVAGGFGPRQ